MQQKSQSAMEYLMTYGWAILIIAVAIAVLYSFGVFSGVSGISSGACIPSPGYECTNPVLYQSGVLSASIAQISQSITVTGIACTTNYSQGPSSFSSLSTSIPLAPGQTAVINFTCAASGQPVGTSFSGALWLQYNIQGGPSGVERMIGKVDVPVSLSGGQHVSGAASFTDNGITFAVNGFAEPFPTWPYSNTSGTTTGSTLTLNVGSYNRTFCGVAVVNSGSSLSSWNYQNANKRSYGTYTAVGLSFEDDGVCSTTQSGSGELIGVALGLNKSVDNFDCCADNDQLDYWNQGSDTESDTFSVGYANTFSTIIVACGGGNTGFSPPSCTPQVPSYCTLRNHVFDPGGTADVYLYTCLTQIANASNGGGSLWFTVNVLRSGADPEVSMMMEPTSFVDANITFPVTYTNPSYMFGAAIGTGAEHNFNRQCYSEDNQNSTAMFGDTTDNPPGCQMDNGPNSQLWEWNGNDLAATGIEIANTPGGSSGENAWGQPGSLVGNNDEFNINSGPSLVVIGVSCSDGGSCDRSPGSIGVPAGCVQRIDENYDGLESSTIYTCSDLNPELNFYANATNSNPNGQVVVEEDEYDGGT